MKCKGIIKNLSKLVVSDPHYLQDVWCRYEKDFSDKKDWIVEFLIREVDEMQEYKGEKFRVQGLDFSILIKNVDSLSKLVDISKYSYKVGTEFKKAEIGIDTAQVCMGTNKKAEEINAFAKQINKEDSFENLFSQYNPSFAIQTMSDGKLGDVIEGTINGKTDFILIDGFFDECADVTTVDELKEYIVEQLNIENLEIQKDITKNQNKNDLDYDCKEDL